MDASPTITQSSLHNRSVTCWRVGDSQFLAVPELGARLLQWDWNRPGQPPRNVIYWPAGLNGEELPVVRGGNPILFPFCARCMVDGRIFQWRDAQGVVRPMPIHGIARQGMFRVTQLHATGFSAILMPDEAAMTAYPFDYEFEVTYEFGSDRLTVGLSLTNKGTTPIPWSAGHHFYLRLPWSDGRQRRDYEVAIPSTKNWQQDPRGRLVAGRKFAPSVPLDNPDLVATFHGGLESDQVIVRENSTGSAVRFDLHGAHREFPDAVFTTWTQDAEVPYYCFEPWLGPANSPETGVGLHWVPPGKSQRFSVSVSLEGPASSPPRT